MFTEVPKGVRSFTRDGANPFQPIELVKTLVELKGLPS